MNKNPELLKIKTKDDEIKNLKNKTEKHDHKTILKSYQIDNEYSKKKYINLNKKKILLVITELLIGGGSTISSSTLAILNLSASIVISSSAALLTSIAILITNDYISKLKIGNTKLMNWINVIALLYEKTLKTSMADKKPSQTEAEELKKIYNH